MRTFFTGHSEITDAGSIRRAVERSGFTVIEALSVDNQHVDAWATQANIPHALVGSFHAAVGDTDALIAITAIAAIGQHGDVIWELCYAARRHGLVIFLWQPTREAVPIAELCELVREEPEDVDRISRLDANQEFLSAVERLSVLATLASGLEELRASVFPEELDLAELRAFQSTNPPVASAILRSFGRFLNDSRRIHATDDAGAVRLALGTQDGTRADFDERIDWIVGVSQLVFEFPQHQFKEMHKKAHLLLSVWCWHTFRQYDAGIGDDAISVLCLRALEILRQGTPFSSEKGLWIWFKSSVKGRYQDQIGGTYVELHEGIPEIDAEPPDQISERREAREAWSEATQKLNPEQRSILQHKYKCRERLSDLQIADMLWVNDARSDRARQEAVRRLRMRVVQIIRLQLEANDISPRYWGTEALLRLFLEVGDFETPVESPD